MVNAAGTDRLYAGKEKGFVVDNEFFLLNLPVLFSSIFVHTITQKSFEAVEKIIAFIIRCKKDVTSRSDIMNETIILLFAAFPGFSLISLLSLVLHFT